MQPREDIAKYQIDKMIISLQYCGRRYFCKANAPISPFPDAAHCVIGTWESIYWDGSKIPPTEFGQACVHSGGARLLPRGPKRQLLRVVFGSGHHAMRMPIRPCREAKCSTHWQPSAVSTNIHCQELVDGSTPKTCVVSGFLVFLVWLQTLHQRDTLAPLHSLSNSSPTKAWAY